MQQRTTIKDIARVAGVSPGAVSFALNDRPGVSEETRARIKRIAAELGWTRSAAATALSGQRAGALGIVLQRGTGEDYAEAFVMRFMAGVQAVLRPLGQSLVFQMVTDTQQELQTYRQWWGERRVDGVVLMRPCDDDPRPDLLAELGMPGVVIGGHVGQRLGSVCADEQTTSWTLVDHFAARGHRRIAYVTGPRERTYLQWRSEAFRSRALAAGMEPVVVHVESQDEMAGMQASQRLVRGHEAPTAIVYDNELLVIGGVAAAHDAGLVVGRDVCMASYEDSPALRMQRPGITALRRQSEELGSLAATMLLGLVDGRAPELRLAPLPELAVRGSSGRLRPGTRDGAALDGVVPNGLDRAVRGGGRGGP